MRFSALNGESCGIFPGFAVYIKNDKAYLAKVGDKVAGITSDGARPKEVVTVRDAEIVSLNDWTLATGKKRLRVGAVYYASTKGKLSTTPSGQIVGQAETITDLHVMLSENRTSASSYETVVEVPSNCIITGVGSPTSNSGDYEQFYHDKSTGAIWGPKGVDGWSVAVRPFRGFDAQIDFGAKGDGVTDDTEALQSGVLAAYDAQCELYIPHGTYSVSHPIVIPWYTKVRGAGNYMGATIAAPQQGTIIRATVDFDTDYNLAFVPTAAWPAYDHIPPAILQSETWAPDPSGGSRWAFNTAGRDYWNGSTLSNLSLDGQDVAGLGGIYMDSPAENGVIDNISIQHCGGAGMWITGNVTGFTIRDSSIWYCMDNAIKNTTNPYFWKIARANPSGLGWTSSGNLRLFGISGDVNSPAFFHKTQALGMLVMGLKYESPYTTNDSVVVFDVDPTIAGTLTGGCRQGARSTFALIGGNAQATINVGPYHPGVGYSLFHIKTTGSADYREWNKPVITCIGVQSYFNRIIQDDSYQIFPDTFATPRCWGSPGYATDALHEVNNPMGFFVYSNDTNERGFTSLLDYRIIDGTVTFPDATHIP